MFMLKSLGGSLLVACLALASLTGCNGNKIQEENAALRSQNNELQSELDAARRAQDSAAADRDRWMSQAQKLQGELSSRPTQVVVQPPQQQQPQQPTLAATGFEGIAGVETSRSGGAITVRVPGDVLFASGKVDLKSTAQKTLDQIASVIQSQYPSQTVRVEGYTDSDPIKKSKWKDNLELSLQRAAAVERYLETRGVTSDRVYSAGFGDAKPQATKAKSRRVEIVVIDYE